MHPVALLSFFIPRVFMLFCLISLHYVNGINKVMMMMTSFPIYRYHYMNRSDNIEQTRLTAFPDMLAMSRSWLKTPTTVSLAGTNIVCCLDRLDCHTQQQTRWVATSTASSTLSPTDDKQLRIKVNTKLLISIVLSSNRMWNNTTLRSPKQQIWLRTALCGGWCRRMALHNRELHVRNDDDVLINS